MNKVQPRHAEEVSIRKKTSHENADILIDDIKFAKTDSV